jgi:hypothetical protein
MELTMMDRFMLLKYLPKEGGFATLKIVQTLKTNLAPSEEEHKDLSIVENQETGNVTWNPEKGAIPKEIAIGEKATDIIVMSLKKADKDGALVEQALPVYEKFIKPEGK